tara:strand:- start:3813 stop:4178 length:366 start_codon:yes stop_codon:yes gene_type:complete
LLPDGHKESETRLTKVVHCKIDPYDVYIGRGSQWGNPFSHREGTKAEFVVSSRDEAISKYRDWLMEQPHLLSQLSTLKGKTLGCWCKIPQDPDRPCHGDVLAELADNPPEGIKTIYDDLDI